eukprot:2801138-Amphidinium_carterae.1
MLMPPPGTPMVQQMLPPPPTPPPLSGRSGPYDHGPGGPGRIPVTPPAIAGMAPAVQVPVGGDAESDDFVGIGEPDNPVAISELVAHLTQSSGATHSRLDVLRLNLRRQQLDVNAEEEFASRLQQ